MSRSPLLLLTLWLAATAGPASADEIHEAALRGDLEKVRALISSDPAQMTLKGRNDKLPLHWASQGGHLPVVALLLDRGADPNCRNNNDETPLQYAAAFGHQAVAELLLARGADLESRSRQGATPLMEAAVAGRADLVRFLLARGADSLARDFAGTSALDRMCAAGMWELVREHVTATPERVKGEMGVAVLHAVAARGNGPLAEELLARGADPRSVSPTGDTLLLSAAKGGLLDLSKRLLEQGQDPKAVDSEGRTALHYAVRADAPALVEMLVTGGADLNARGADGRAALDIAQDNGFTSLVKALGRLGARTVPRPVHLLGEGRSGARAQVEITYIGNEGFLVASADARLMIDALQGPQNFGYVGVSDALFERMLSGATPFEKVPLLLASHAHADHFHPGMAAAFLRRHPETRLAGNALVVEGLEASDPAAVAEVKERVQRVEPEWGKPLTETVGGLTVTAYPVNHATPDQPYKTCAFLFEVGGIKLFHLADSIPESNAGYFAAFGLEKEDIDIAFVDPFLLQSQVGRDILTRHIRPRAVVLMHMRPGEPGRYLAELSPTTPNLYVFREPMEKQVFAR